MNKIDIITGLQYTEEHFVQIKTPPLTKWQYICNVISCWIDRWIPELVIDVFIRTGLIIGYSLSIASIVVMTTNFVNLLK